jgi:hypothetical protein
MGAALLLLGCGLGVPSNGNKTVQSVMGDIDTAADTIWEAVSTTETADGAEVARPRDKAAWDRLAGRADALLGAARDLRGGLPVAPPNAAVADAHVAGTRTADQIAHDIAANPAAFEAKVALFEAAARDMRGAIGAHDADALLESGERLDASCDSCHRAYWHPRERPAAMPADAVFAQSRP